MRKLESMDDVMLTPEAVLAWGEMAKRLSKFIVSSNVRPEDIKDEEIFLKDDGKTLVIRCQAGKMIVTMDVPEGQWTWNN